MTSSNFRKHAALYQSGPAHALHSKSLSCATLSPASIPNACIQWSWQSTCGHTFRLRSRFSSRFRSSSSCCSRTLLSNPAFKIWDQREEGQLHPAWGHEPRHRFCPSRQSTGSETSTRCHLLASDTSKLSHVSETGDKGGLRQQTEGSSQQLLRKRMQLEAFAKYRSAHCLLGQQ